MPDMDKNFYKNIVFNSSRLEENELVSSSGGNISVKKNNSVYISSSGKSLSGLEKNDFSVLFLDKKDNQDVNKASSEWKMHLECYNRRNDINAVVHAHPIYATVLGITSDTKVSVSYELESSLDSSRIKKIEYLIPGSSKLSSRVGEEVKSADALILAGHGVVTVGKDIKEAVDRSIILERESRRWILQKMLMKVDLINKEMFCSIENRLDI